MSQDSPFSSVRAIYFDLDDTLCGYWEASTKALRQTFDTHAPGQLATDVLIDHWAAAFREFIPEIKSERWYADYLKRGEITRTEQMRRALNKAGLDDEAMANQLSQTYLECRDRNLALFPDALFVLDRLKALYPLGLITNGPADVQRMEILTLGIGQYFSNFFIEGEVGFGKPEAEVFRRAAAAVSLDPSQILFVGNSYAHDILPAIAAGWKTAWMRRPSDVPPSSKANSKPEERHPDKPAPTVEITELAQLLPLLSVR